jgi:hypothetical protein
MAADVIAAVEGGLPNAVLIHRDAIFRQAAESCIVDNAHRFARAGRCSIVAAFVSVTINAHRVARGQMPVTDDPEATDFFMACTYDPARAVELIEQLVCEHIPTRFGFGPDYTQVLSPMHRREASVAT